jgi:hypothetical protein
VGNSWRLDRICAGKEMGRLYQEFPISHFFISQVVVLGMTYPDPKQVNHSPFGNKAVRCASQSPIQPVVR